ncbi:hypothetical protein GW537_18055 (plasmid) [Piscirickettsia salmonis]|nr:hypothetical protein [Piscirickettsia salmonis]QHS27553.1 hypothetical protein GW538_16715 [Piscirickettsia salmonis]QHS30924.1 hypothetical protein GW537_18055 [Piscirickettsia salmonis]
MVKDARFNTQNQAIDARINSLVVDFIELTIFFSNKGMLKGDFNPAFKLLESLALPPSSPPAFSTTVN